MRSEDPVREVYIEHLIKHISFLLFYVGWNQITLDTQGSKSTCISCPFKKMDSCRQCTARQSGLVQFCSVLNSSTLDWPTRLGTYAIIQRAKRAGFSGVGFFKITWKYCTLLLNNCSPEQGNSYNKNCRRTNLSLRNNPFSVPILPLCHVISTVNSFKLIMTLSPSLWFSSAIRLESRLSQLISHKPDFCPLGEEVLVESIKGTS